MTIKDFFLSFIPSFLPSFIHSWFWCAAWGATGFCRKALLARKHCCLRWSGNGQGGDPLWWWVGGRYSQVDDNAMDLGNSSQWSQCYKPATASVSSSQQWLWRDSLKSKALDRDRKAKKWWKMGGRQEASFTSFAWLNRIETFKLKFYLLREQWLDDICE